MPAWATDTEAMATGPRVMAAASATKAPASTTPARAARRRNSRGSTSPPVSSATGTTMTQVAALPIAARETGGSAVASAKKSKVPANRAAESSAQPAPAVARVRRALPQGALRRPLHRRQQPAGDRQRQADPGDGESVSPPRMAITATNPPASDASGVTTERLPVTSPREERASAEASQHAARRRRTRRRATGRRRAAGRRRRAPAAAGSRGRRASTQHERRPQRRRAHDADQQVVVDGVAERRAEAEDDGEHGRTLRHRPRRTCQNGARACGAGAPSRRRPPARTVRSRCGRP